MELTCRSATTKASHHSAIVIKLRHKPHQIRKTEKTKIKIDRKFCKSLTIQEKLRPNIKGINTIKSRDLQRYGPHHKRTATHAIRRQKELTTEETTEIITQKNKN